MFTIGIRSGRPSSEVSVVISGRPSMTRLTSKLVPPMSTPIRFGRSSRRASATRPIEPPTGPESSVCTGRSRAERAVTTPPLDCITCRGDAQSALVQLALEPLEVSAHRRAGVRVEHGGRRALVLAPFGGDSMRQRDRKVTELLAQDLLGAQLVRRIEVGEEEADGDGTEGLVLGATGGGTDGLLVERRQLLARPVEPAADLDGVSPRDERRRLAVVELVQLRPVAAGDLVRVADALRGEQQDALASPLEERVQPDGRAVDEEADLGHVLDDLRERGEDAFGQILRPSSRPSLPRRCRRLPGRRRRP